MFHIAGGLKHSVGISCNLYTLYQQNQRKILFLYRLLIYNIHQIQGVYFLIVLGSDHAGFELKQHIKQYLSGKGLEFRDMGCDSAQTANYALFGEAAAREVAEGHAELAIVICGTGLGISMAANKVNGIRAALCTNEFMARMSRMHNDANVLALGGRVIGPSLAEAIVDAFLTTGFEGGRHADRLKLLMDIENRH
jgi:ribose 5-phosphate isomerase B